MLDEVGNIVGLGIYTPKGIYVGNVDNVVMDVRSGKIDGLFVKNSSPVLVENGTAVNIPYRWVQSVGDIIILKMFPDKVKADQ